jgi:hypothetical protein
MRIRHFAKISFLVICISISSHLGAEEYRIGEVFAGYSLLHGDLQKRAGGWEISAGKTFNKWLSLHADFDAHHQSSSGSQRHQHDFLFGTQFSHHTNRFTLFAHTLAGGCRTAGSLGTEAGFASVVGGGIDLDHHGFFSLRLAQVDYQSAHVFGGFQQQARFSFGIVFRIVEFRDYGKPPPDKKGSHEEPLAHRQSLAAVSHP